MTTIYERRKSAPTFGRQEGYTSQIERLLKAPTWKTAKQAEQLFTKAQGEGCYQDAFISGVSCESWMQQTEASEYQRIQMLITDTLARLAAQSPSNSSR